MNLPSFPSLPAWSSLWRAAVVGADLTLCAPHGVPLKTRNSQKTKTGGPLYTDCTKRRRKLASLRRWGKRPLDSPLVRARPGQDSRCVRILEAGGVGIFWVAENKQLIDFSLLTIREKLTNHGFHTRITHIAFCSPTQDLDTRDGFGLPRRINSLLDRQRTHWRFRFRAPISSIAASNEALGCDPTERTPASAS